MHLNESNAALNEGDATNNTTSNTTNDDPIVARTAEFVKEVTKMADEVFSSVLNMSLDRYRNTFHKIFADSDEALIDKVTAAATTHEPIAPANETVTTNAPRFDHVPLSVQPLTSGYMRVFVNIYINGHFAIKVPVNVDPNNVPIFTIDGIEQKHVSQQVIPTQSGPVVNLFIYEFGHSNRTKTNSFGNIVLTPEMRTAMIKYYGVFYNELRDHMPVAEEKYLDDAIKKVHPGLTEEWYKDRNVKCKIYLDLISGKYDDC